MEQEAKETKEVCITKEEYQILMSTVRENSKGVAEATGLLKEVKSDVEQVKTDVKIIKPVVQTTNNIVIGNGHPEQGLLYRLVQLEAWRIEREKEDTMKKERTWDIVRPLVVDFLKVILFGGSLGGVVYALLNLAGGG